MLECGPEDMGPATQRSQARVSSKGSLSAKFKVDEGVWSAAHHIYKAPCVLHSAGAQTRESPEDLQEPCTTLGVREVRVVTKCQLSICPVSTRGS